MGKGIFGIVWLKDWAQTADGRQIIGYAGRVDFGAAEGNVKGGLMWASITGAKRNVQIQPPSILSVEWYEDGLPEIKNTSVEVL